jgi:hypothetical protein
MLILCLLKTVSWPKHVKAIAAANDWIYCSPNFLRLHVKRLCSVLPSHKYSCMLKVESTGSHHCVLWRKHSVSLKCKPFFELHGVITQKTITLHTHKCENLKSNTFITAWQYTVTTSHAWLFVPRKNIISLLLGNAWKYWDLINNTFSSQVDSHD